MKRDDSFQTNYSKNLNRSDSINKTEIKILENKTDNKFSANIDKLNESLYKINNFLKLKKDIDDLKRENLARNDIQRKLSLKSQWLNTSHGSTTSLNSLPNFEIRSSASESNENVALGKDKENIEDASKECRASNPNVAPARKKLANFKFASVQNLSSTAERRKRYLENKDELKFVHSLDLSDQDIAALSREPEFEEKRTKFKESNDDLTDKMKNIELQSFSETMKNMQCHHTGPKISTSSSQRDLSKYFPKKVEKVQSSTTNLNQKELKDVDLSKYFAPAPVQELKSLPSPSASPNLPRKPIASDAKKPPTNIAKQVILREAITKALTVPDINESPEPSTANLTANRPKDEYNLYDQQLDGAVILRRRSKQKLITPAKSIDDVDVNISDERSPSREYSKLFESDNARDEDIDEIFEEVAAKLIPELPDGSTEDKKRKSKELDSHQQPDVKKYKQKKKDTTRLPTKKATKSASMAIGKPLWCKQEIDDCARNDYLLSKLSNTLVDEIKILEEQLLAGEQSKKSPRPVKAPRRKESPKKSDFVLSDTAASDTELDNAIDSILNGVEVSKLQQQSKVPSSQNLDQIDGTTSIENIDKLPDKSSNYEQPVTKPPRTKKKATIQRNAEVQPSSERKNDIIAKPPRSPKESSSEHIPVKAVDEIRDTVIEKPPRSRKNSVSDTFISKSDDIKETLVERPPRSRKNSLVEQPTPKAVDDMRDILVERPPRSRKNSITEPSPPKATAISNNLIERPPHSRKNSINEQTPVQPTENKIFADEPALQRALLSYRQLNREPEEWNMNGAYEPRSPVKKFDDGGYDTVDKQTIMKTLDVVGPARATQIQLNGCGTQNAAVNGTPARKVPPPKPIRRNKSNSSIDRLESEESNRVKRVHSFNDRVKETGRLEANDSRINNVIKSDSMKRQAPIDVNKAVDMKPINIAAVWNTDSNYSSSDEKPFLSIENQLKRADYEKRGINIDQWSQRRDDLNRHQSIPDHLSYRNDYKTGFIPLDDLRNRQNNLSNYQDQIPPSNDLSALLENITKESENNSRTNEYTTQKYPTKDIYENINNPPTDDFIPSRRVSNNYDYDNLSKCDKVEAVRKRSLREGYLDNTERLLQRSRLIHDRKQEFMDEQISGNNPYIKRMIKRNSGEYLPTSSASERNYEEPITNYKSVRGHTSARLTQAPSVSSLNKTRGSNKSLNSISSASRSVKDLFKKSSEKPKGKEGGCSVS